MKAVAIIVLVVVLFAFLVPMVQVAPAALLVRAVHAVKMFVVHAPFVPFRGGIPRGIVRFTTIGTLVSRSPRSAAIIDLDCALLC